MVLVSRGYTLDSADQIECAFLGHPKGRKFPQYRLMVYDNGTIVGMDDFRIRSDDDEAFLAFVRSIPKL